ncbi:MAG: aryl-sulfate sulfotransferase [Bacteroidota bacterium]
MRHLHIIIAIQILFPILLFGQSLSYVSPIPNSLYNSTQTTIILRSAERVDRHTVTTDAIRVTGSISGIHAGTFFLSDDDHTLLFQPKQLFKPSETVSVSLNSTVRTMNGVSVEPKEFVFTISAQTEEFQHPWIENEKGELVPAPKLYDDENIAKNGIAFGDSLPTDFPVITVSEPNNPDEGKIFIANKPAVSNTTYGNYILIADNSGNILKYKKFTQAESNFKVLPNGMLAFSENSRHIVTDTALTLIDTFKCGNGYTADSHDFLLLPNGHSLLLAYDSQPVDMSLIVPGGNPNATVIGTIIQELDASKNVVFQWRSWDYLPITSSYINLTTKTVDYSHGNALEIDRDGNIYIVLRHTSNVVKINRLTGNIMWILGGKQNDFTFINEHEFNSPNYFSYPHNMSILPNGNITLFDNGDQHTPMYSRGVEYALDEKAKTVTMVWEYRHTPDIYTASGGSVQRLPNGNTIVGWSRGGSTNGMPVFTEVRPDSTIALEVFFPPGQFSYRSYKYPWVSMQPKASVTKSEVLIGNTYEFNDSKETTGVTITFQQLTADLYCSASVTTYAYAPVNPDFVGQAPLMEPYFFKIESQLITSYQGKVEVDLNNFPGIMMPQTIVVYARPQYSSIFIPIPTAYDSVKNQLVFTTTDFGEFAFGIPQIVSPLAPVPISPRDNEIVNGETAVKLQWGTQGITETFHIQVDDDSTFLSPLEDTQLLTSTTTTLSSLANNTTYYWRVNTTNAAGTSAWSTISSFITASPFITIAFPNGGEQLYKDSTYIIRWQSNVIEAMRVVLIKGSTVVSVVSDSIVSRTNAVLWKVSSSIQSDSMYSIIITSKIHPALNDSSDTVFTVASGVLGITNVSAELSSCILHQNYPNPFNPSTTIQFVISSIQHVRMTIFDVLGKEITVLVNEPMNAGSYSVAFNGEQLPSGMYFCRLQAGTFVSVKKLLLVK